MTCINYHEILIMGGDGANGFQSDAFLIDTRLNTFKKVLDGETNQAQKICSWSNQCYKTKQNQIYALVQDESWQPKIISYDKGHSTIKTIPITTKPQ